MGEMIKYGIKAALALLAAGAFMVAVSQLVSWFTTVAFAGVLGETLALIGIFMPWKPSALAIIGTAIQAGLTFLVAHKTYQLLSDYNRQTS